MQLYTHIREVETDREITEVQADQEWENLTDFQQKCFDISDEYAQELKDMGLWEDKMALQQAVFMTQLFLDKPDITSQILTPFQFYKQLRVLVLQKHPDRIIYNSNTSDEDMI